MLCDPHAEERKRATIEDSHGNDTYYAGQKPVRARSLWESIRKILR